MKNWKILSKTKKFENADQIILELFKNRGIKEKEDNFLNPKLENISVKNVGIDKKELDKAVKRIKKSIKNKEKIVIYGDYDADGICSTAILWETIHDIYENVIPYIPHRIDEGYGLSINGIKNLMSLYKDIKVIITVDNGIVAYEAIKFANENNIDVIVTDHHIKGEKKLPAFAIVHTTDLCGAGVAFMLSLAIQDKKRIEDEKFLDLVAIATISDLVPLVNSNRILVKFGLKALQKTNRVGLLTLFNIARIKKEEIGVYEIGYIIGPRLNASGRLASAMDSLRLLCTSNLKRAEEYARNLDSTNKERQSLTAETTIHAKSYSSATGITSKIIFVSHIEYNQGVIGLVASKLVEEYYRPSFVISIGEKFSKGSARSINGVNIIELIRSAGEHLIDAGGHPMAAGFTVETEKIEIFRKTLEEKADTVVTIDLLKRTVVADLKIEFSNINTELSEKIKMLSPFGIGNSQPAFMTENTEVIDAKKVGQTGKHLKLVLKKDRFIFNAIAFGFGEKKDIKIGDNMDIIYTIEDDNWNGNKKLQLKIKDIKKCSN